VIGAVTNPHDLNDGAYDVALDLIMSGLIAVWTVQLLRRWRGRQGQGEDT
jgi:hypothetical protein